MKCSKEKIHTDVKKIGVVCKNPDDLPYISAILAKFQITPIANFSDIRAVLDETSLFLSVGGDGTLISLCRKLALKKAYIMGVNAGTLGFLTDIELCKLEEFFKNFLDGRYVIEHPKMLEVRVKKSQKELKKYAFNDVVITRKNIATMSKIDAYLDGKYFNTYWGDGVIITSPIGSTGYNMSAMGPIIYPLSDVFCITPICSHSLTQRPLLLPKQYTLSFKNSISNDIVAIIDGQDIINLKDFDEIFVTLGDKGSNLVKNIEHDYFDVLKRKLGWGQSLK